MNEEFEGKWTFSDETGESWHHDLHDTLEGAKQAALDYFEDGDHFYIGQTCFFTEIPTINTDFVLEDAGEYIYDQVGESAAEYLNNVSYQHQHILQRRLNDVFQHWLEEFNYLPKYYQIENIKNYWRVGNEVYSPENINSD